MATNMTPQDTLPPPVQQIAAAQQLGAFIKAYGVSINGTIIGAFIFLAGSIFFFVGGFSPSDLEVTVRVVLLTFAVLFLGMTIYLLSTVIQIANQNVYLFQQGLVIDKNKRVQAFPWNQIAEVWQSITRNYRNGGYVSTTYLYTLRRSDGYQVKLNNLTKEIAELGSAMMQGVTRELVPRALHAMQNGQTLTFAPFSINQQGISNRQDNIIPWQQVQEVDVKQGRVSIKRVGAAQSSWTTTVAKIPNFFVFIVIVEEMRRQAGSGK